MTTPSSFNATAADNVNEDDPHDALHYAHEEPDSSHFPSQDPDPDIHMGDDSFPDAKPKESLPMQKRRRVTRACDECRRKKIKCDGKQPCTHCTVYSYECTYDQPSNRRRNPAPQYVEALEHRLHKAEALLRVVLPDLDLDDPRFDEHATEQMLAAIRRESQQAQPQIPPPPASQPAQSSQPSIAPNTPQSVTTTGGPSDGTQPPTSVENDSAGDESMLESMVENSGCLDLDDQGHWDYHGHTSGIIFIRRLRKQLGASDMQPPSMRTRPVQQMLESPKSVSESPQDASLPPTQDLPSRDVARRLCHSALEDGCSLMRFVHEPSFYAMLERIYDTPTEQFTNEENSFLPLLYIVMSVGCLFSDDGTGLLDVSGYESAIGQGFQYFKAGRQLLEITDCRDLTSLQAICFMVLFLQSSAKLSTCYSYVGIALRSALRLGLHRSVTANFNPVERELRKRVFWVVRKMDVYVSTLLGLPQMLSDDDIDQEYPMAIDGDFITPNGILPAPTDYTPLMAGANAHTRLSTILLKVVKYIYPVKNAQHRSKSDQRYVVSHSKIREIERDLQAWMEELPATLRPGTEVSPQLERVRQLLRISYAHVQVVMYRPFLHYVSSGSQARGLDRRSYACAAACVSVSRNIVHITTGMHKHGLLNGSFWFTMYTTYFAILSLLFFVLENPDSPTAKDGILKDAMEGKTTLGGLAKKSMAADRCSQSLNCLFKNLPELLKNRQSAVAPVNLKRPAPTHRVGTINSPAVAARFAPQRSNTFPLQLLTRPTKAEASNTPKTMDDNYHSSPQPRPNQPPTPSWMPSTPVPRSDSVSTPATMDHPHAPSNMPLSSFPIPGHESPGTGFRAPSAPPPAYPGGSHLPDLMPIMFPSDDPFAYPTQPMSTLENDHFREDGTPFSMGANNPLGLSAAGLDNLNSLGMFPHGPTSSGGMNTTGLPSQLTQAPPQPQSQPPMSQSRLQSPVSHGSTTPGEAINSPDLVSIPNQNQNFLWQGYNFQPGTSQPTMTSSTAVPDFSDLGSLDDAHHQTAGPAMGLGMGLDLGIPLDDIFGNGEALRMGYGNHPYPGTTTNGPDAGNGNGNGNGNANVNANANANGTDDWTQWMNVG